MSKPLFHHLIEFYYILIHFNFESVQLPEFLSYTKGLMSFICDVYEVKQILFSPLLSPNFVCFRLKK